MIEHDEIKKYLRHRYPILLVDRVLEVDADHIVAIKNVTGSDCCVQGHFPDEAILPGVLLIEAMAQTGGLLFQNQKIDEPPKGAYLAKVDNVKFKKLVRPGDQVVLSADHPKMLGKMARVTVAATVAGVEVSSGEITYHLGD